MMNLKRFLGVVATVVLLFARVPSNAAAAEPVARVDLTGKWSGCWVSDKNGHQGPLHATFCKVDDCHYEVRFHGRFWKVVPFAYGITFSVTGYEGERVLLSGCKRIPGFGTFECSAVATNCDFTATFTARNDCGEFKLSRK